MGNPGSIGAGLRIALVALLLSSDFVGTLGGIDRTAIAGPDDAAARTSLRDALVAAYAATPTHLARFRVEKHGDADGKPFEVELFQDGALVGLLTDLSPAPPAGSGAMPATTAPWRTGPFQAVDAETSVLIEGGRVVLRSPGPDASRRAAASFDAARVAVGRRCDATIAPAEPLAAGFDLRLATAPEEGKFDWHLGVRCMRGATPSWLQSERFASADTVTSTDTDVVVVEGPLTARIRRVDGMLVSVRCTRADDRRTATLTAIVPTWSAVAWREAIRDAIALPEAPDAATRRGAAIAIDRELAFGDAWRDVTGPRRERVREAGPCRIAIVEELVRALLAYGRDEAALPRSTIAFQSIIERTLRDDPELDAVRAAELGASFAAELRAAIEGPGSPATPSR